MRKGKGNVLIVFGLRPTALGSVAGDIRQAFALSGFFPERVSTDKNGTMAFVVFSPASFANAWKIARQGLVNLDGRSLSIKAKL